MKKITKLLLIAGFILAGQCVVYGQQGKIALHHNGGLTIYTDLTIALAGAQNGDTLYLPGGTVYCSSGVTINKTLTIIGAGHFPDSTAATYKTVIPTTVYVLTGADNGSLSGIQCENLEFGTGYSAQNVNNYRIERCKIGTLRPSQDNTSTSQNIQIYENVIENLVGSNYGWPPVYLGFSTAIFEKNIFGTIQYEKVALFNNNIFYSPAYTFTLSMSTFNNCIIIYTGSNQAFFIGSTNTIFNNTLVCKNDTNGLTLYYTGMSNNPVNSEYVGNTFINAASGIFSYSNNYHLKTTSNGHNAGTDGTDIGIFGTQFPAKDGAVPFNPHISSKSIGTVVSPSGTLSVDVKVSAQDR